MNYLTEKVKCEIEKHAMENISVECCGLIVFKNQFEVIPCKNISEMPEKHFIISREDREKAEESGNVVAFYHSHPKGEDFSMVDKFVSERLKIDCVVFNCLKKDIRVYKPFGFEAPLVNRPFLIGVFDCFTLARDYYSRELNLGFPEIEHDLRFKTEEFILANQEEIKDKYDNHELATHFLKNGFVEVTGKVLKKNDIILISTFSEMESANCVLVYLGDNKVLAHFEGQNSMYKIYSNNLKRKTANIMRHTRLI